ncbi:hypothetical protein Hanom_Chr03g00210741 [Helianthus anomalus]
MAANQTEPNIASSSLVSQFYQSRPTFLKFVFSSPLFCRHAHDYAAFLLMCLPQHYPKVFHNLLSCLSVSYHQISHNHNHVQCVAANGHLCHFCLHFHVTWADAVYGPQLS